MSAELSRETIIEAVVAATQDVFSTMLAMEAVPGGAKVDDSSTGPTEGVVGIVGMAGAWIGTGTLSLSAPLACRIAGAMLMAEYEAVNDDVLDAIAEVSNMVIGNLKTNLEEFVGIMGLSIPTVVFGKNFATRTMRDKEWIVIEFSVDGQRLDVHVCLQPNQAGGGPARPGYSRLHQVSG